MIDLHMHSHCSDGTDSPEQLVILAKKLGLKAIALTDHDTILGLPALQRAAELHDLDVLSGLELSVDARLPNDGHLHLLGYGFDPTHRQFGETLTWLRDERAHRAEKIVAKLRSHQVDITWPELVEYAGESAIGRPHIGALLIKRKYVNTMQEAFDKYLGVGQPGYVPKAKLNEQAAIDLIHRAGGLAILAHPHFMGFSEFSGLQERLEKLGDLGLDGVEAWYSGMPPEFAAQLRSYADERGMICTGGSDYHGSVKPDIKMGTGIGGDLEVPDDLIAKLRQRLSINS